MISDPTGMNPTGMLDRILLVLGAFDADHVDRTQAELVHDSEDHQFPMRKW